MCNVGGHTADTAGTDERSDRDTRQPTSLPRTASGDRRGRRCSNHLDSKLCVVPHSDANQSNGSDSADYAIGDGANAASASIVAGRRQRGLGRW